MKKLLSIVMIMMLVLGMSTVAFADETTEETTYTDMGTVTITKTYQETNEGTTSPAETFSFSALKCVKVEDAGVVDGVVVTTATAPVPTIASVNYAAGEAGSATATKDITITLPEYKAVGVYTYTFSEVDGKTAGVTYYEDTITLKVTVIEQDGKVRVAAVHTEGEGEGKSDDFENEYSAGSLAVQKVVTGNMGDQQKDFTVTVTFTAPEGDTVREAISYTDDGVDKTIEAGWNTTAEATITLKHDETVTFTNIPYGVTYTVVEDNYKGDGYDEAIYDFSDDEKNINTPSDNVTITNNKDGAVDTGIFTDNAPYIAMLLMVGAGIVAITRKRAMED